MESLEITSLSTKGQVVIPREIRKHLDLHPGHKFVVLGQGDTIILKIIQKPSFEGFDELLSETRQFAKKRKLKKSDVNAAIKSVRKQKNDCGFYFYGAPVISSI